MFVRCGILCNQMLFCLGYLNEPDILFKDVLKSLSYGPNHILFQLSMNKVLQDYETDHREQGLWNVTKMADLLRNEDYEVRQTLVCKSLDNTICIGN